MAQVGNQSVTMSSCVKTNVENDSPYRPSNLHSTTVHKQRFEEADGDVDEHCFPSALNTQQSVRCPCRICLALAKSQTLASQS